MHLGPGNYRTHDLRDINFNWFLPDIQREFVWLKKPSEKRIEKLFDSILKGYPIGNFLMWKIRKDDAENQKLCIYKFIEEYNPNQPHNPAVNNMKEDIRNDEFSLVLDGQQRLTALYIGLMGKYYKRSKGKLIATELYLNLSHRLDKDNPDDIYELEFLTSEQANRKDKGEAWFKVKDFLKQNIEQIAEGYPQQYFQTILLMQNKILNREIPTCVISDTNVDEALQLFVRLNSAGMSLKKTDLLMSFISAKFNKFDIRQEISDLVDKWENDGFAQFNSDKFLSTCMLMTGDNAKFKVADFTTSRVEIIEKKWNKIVDSIDDAIKLLKKFGYQGTGIAANIITSLALYAYKKAGIPSDDNPVILDFIQRMQLTGFFRESTDNQLNQVKKAIEDSHCFQDVFNKLSDDLKISEDNIEKIVTSAEYSEPTTFAVLQLLFPNINYNEGFGIDHIYPQKHFFKQTKIKGKVHKLFNLQILTKSENSSKNDIDPSKWIKDKTPEFRRQHFIPEDINLEWDEIGKFEEERKKLLIQALKDIFIKQ